MTAPGRKPAPAGVTTATVLARAMTAEWLRLWTLRSTWWALLAGTALMLLIGGAAGSGHAGDEPAPIWYPAEFAIVPGQFAFLLIALLAVTGEYATGAIRSALQWVPGRGVLLAARTLVTVSFAAACAVVVSAATALVAWGFVGDAAEVVPGDIVASLGRIALVVAFGALLTVGLGLLLRSIAGTLVAVFLLLFALPVALGNAGVPWLTAVSDHLPGRAVVAVLAVERGALTAGTLTAVMVAWSVVVMSAGGWSLVRRDTT